ncbi:SLBB domain-containing protein [Amylibacter sp.]|nr:SLBB domain-containing protein [Amylibacter sp.]
MNIKFLRNLFALILLSLCQITLAQTVSEDEILQLLGEYQSSQKQADDKKINKQLTSDEQKVLSLNEMSNKNLNLSSENNNDDLQSISNMYFKALTGQNLKIYGADEFSQVQDGKLLFFNTIGKDYQLAPGDTIQIIITGLSASNKEYQIMNDGTIALDNIYPINVSGLRLDQVSKLILDQISIDDASAKVFVRLNLARLITVQISGNVNSPRTIAVPAYTSLSRVIAYSGGISANGSLRNIALSQIGSETQKIDFYNFLQYPSSNNDPFIKSAARIFIPNKGPSIAVFGFVNNPGIYELPTDVFEISISDILDISGTSFLPPGATLKILYFDTNGQIASRLANKNEIITQGEALQVDFIETRDLNTSKITGAVLKNYEIKTNKPLSIKEILKGGSVLKKNAHYTFALIDGEEIQAINLYDALEDENIILPVGSDLKIFTKKEYLSLVAEDTNGSLNPDIEKLSKSKNLAEIYLNGMRIAYVPVNSENTFYKSISDFYIPGPKTVADIALIKNTSSVEAVDFKAEVGKQGRRKLINGDKLFIFENKFYDDLLSYMASYDKIKLQPTPAVEADESTSLEVFLLQQEMQNEQTEYLEALRHSQKLLQQANNIINIKLDGELFTYLPFISGISSLDVLNKLQNRLPKLASEFTIVQNININKTPEIKNLNYPFEIKKSEEINFISNRNYRLAIKNYDNIGNILESNLVTELKSSNAVKVYYDGKLVLLLPPNYKPSELNLFEQYTNKSDLYKLYIGLNTISLENETWNFLTFGAEDFFSDNAKFKLGDSNVVHLFSNTFIRNEFIYERENINGVNFNIYTNKKPKNKIVNTEISLAQDTQALSQDSNLKEGIMLKEENSYGNQSDLLSTQIEIMNNSLRTISGSVQFPGSYPVAKKIRLSNFLSTAGLIEQTAKSNIIITEAFNQADRLTRGGPKAIKLDDINLNKVNLTGLYYLDIPLAINDAITGVIELKGEVLIPGVYSFTRSEVLQDIINRAGGLSDVAYPLGAVLQRQTAKELEKETNNILADQLEASILNLAQSSLEGAGDQVKVVLGYATQLRNQPTQGRMTLNILEDNPSNPVFLEDGDILTIPKRPSHVTIVGSVQRSTIATYVQGQNFNGYLHSAGGLTKIADTRKAYLLLPNGESRKLNKSTIIPVGSVIIVPPKLDRLSILGGTDIISRVLSNISNSIISIQNVD